MGASFTYHFKSRHMYTFMHGLEHERYRLFSEVLEQGAARTTLFLIPAYLVQFNLVSRQDSLNYWHRRIKDCEKTMGVRDDHPVAVDVTQLNFVELSKRVQSITTNMAYMAWTCTNTTRQIEFLDEVAEQYYLQAIKNGVMEEEASRVRCTLIDTHAHLRSWNTGLQDRAEYLSKRGQSLVQTVSAV